MKRIFVALILTASVATLGACSGMIPSVTIGPAQGISPIDTAAALPSAPGPTLESIASLAGSLSKLNTALGSSTPTPSPAPF